MARRDSFTAARAVARAAREQEGPYSAEPILSSVPEVCSHLLLGTASSQVVLDPGQGPPGQGAELTGGLP